MRSGAPGLAFVERVDAGALVGTQAEGEGVNVGGHARRTQGIGEDDVAAIDGPAQGDLRGADSEFVADGDEGWGGDGAPACQGRPCFEDHAEFVRVGA